MSDSNKDYIMSLYPEQSSKPIPLSIPGETGGMRPWLIIVLVVLLVAMITYKKSRETRAALAAIAGMIAWIVV